MRKTEIFRIIVIKLTGKFKRKAAPIITMADRHKYAMRTEKITGRQVVLPVILVMAMK
ncbi:hypothetical protein [Undibacterium sp. TJN19]|uniref:hypothetical protein n=1 Tax=Undibacterium sp. TJN19 TaxID=3413055 RepID=UPI003BF316D6